LLRNGARLLSAPRVFGSCQGAYVFLRCLLTSLVISNMET
jgi:hypothetical protein